MGLAGKTTLVTGGGRNIGRAICIEMARAGADIVVNVGSKLDEGEEVVARVTELGRRAIAVQADIAKPDEVERLVTAARAAFGRVDILVNNAAIRPRTPFLEMTSEEWNWVFGVGLHGAFHCARAMAPDMVAAGWGRIINISGRDAWTGHLNRAHGVSVKAGIHGLTKALALELGPRGVVVNTVVPGLIRTTRRAEWYPELDYDERAKGIPVRRPGTPDDVAELCVFLATQRGYINGQALHINGGEFLSS